MRLTDDDNARNLLAHSAKNESVQPDSYRRHIQGVVALATKFCEQMLQYATTPPTSLLETVIAAATFHDLGKLDDDIQQVLSGKRTGRLQWDHIDAGVAHLITFAPMAAWLVRAHHAPGLPSWSHHFADGICLRLRGWRHDDRKKVSYEKHLEQIDRTDANLKKYLRLHSIAAGPFRRSKIKTGMHGLEMRLALSCLVDADHTDTCFYDTGEAAPIPVETRWRERLDQLVNYVESLPKGRNTGEIKRNKTRQQFFDSCLNNKHDGKMFSCEGPVGIGKTTSVIAFLINLAIRHRLRRIVFVAPFTNILCQSADTFRQALVLPDEQGIADQVIVEQHHRADFGSREARTLASLWNAPIVLTTAVSFFETLSSCHPGTLRKLHYLPGSAIFVDEAHAAIPTSLWPQNWKWLNRLVNQWQCRAVLASGSLTRFWEEAEIVSIPTKLPELLVIDQKREVLKSEKRRVKYKMASESVLKTETLCNVVLASKGPRLVILNTVQNAAVVARYLRETIGHDVLHLSTALTPNDRDRIYAKIKDKLGTGQSEWTLVATSCVEAGVDFSFRTAFRERFSVASILQVGGRVNRNSEFNSVGGSIVFDFLLDDTDVTEHPSARESAPIVGMMLENGELNALSPSDAASKAMQRELNRQGGLSQNLLANAEANKEYPEVELLGRVIPTETRIVVVDDQLIEKLNRREKLSFRQLLGGSVQLWSHSIKKLGMESFPHIPELYYWRDAYDGHFLGIMAGLLQQKIVLHRWGCGSLISVALLFSVPLNQCSLKTSFCRSLRCSI